METKQMKTKDFYFDLPQELIAQTPSGERGGSRLMLVDRKTATLEHARVADLPDLIPLDSFLIFNNSRVRKARVFGKGAGGGQVELVFIKNLDKGLRWLCMVRKSGSKKNGTTITIPGGIVMKILEATNGSFLLEATSTVYESYFEMYGHIPLPPYITREDSDADSERYQTVYARETGSAAAPTAGLHFTEAILSALQNKGIHSAELTLHVGLGTFAAVQAEYVDDHHMHSESYSISAECSKAFADAKKNNKKILAVGTTSLRTLESAVLPDSSLPQGSAETEIFIRPGYTFKAVDRLFTNFHTPESTLLMLVSAFAGKDLIEAAYRLAIENKYRFFSYGDAMLIL